MYGRFDPDNDISRIYAQKVDKQFKKEFGKFIPQKSQSDVKTTELNVKLIEAEEKISSLNRTLETRNREIERLQLAQTKALEKSEQLAKSNDTLKGELEKNRRNSQNFDNIKIREKVLLDDYRIALSKYKTWYTYSRKQLELVRKLLEECGGWTEENRYKLYFAYKEIKPFNVDDDEVFELCNNTVLNYPGIEDVESISEFEQRLKYHTMSTQTESCLESAFLVTSSSIPTAPNSQEDPYGESESLTQQQLLNTTIASSSSFVNNAEYVNDSFNETGVTRDELIYLDKIEKIERLECEKANLIEQLIITRQHGNDQRERAKNNALLEEQKNDLINQISIIKRQNGQLIEEYEKLKESLCQMLYKDNSIRRNNVEEILKDISKLRDRNQELEQNLQQGGAGVSTSTHSEEAKRIANFFKEFYDKKISELEKKLAVYEPLHNSDTTRVLRFSGNNPLDEAYSDYILDQASNQQHTVKRRKLDLTQSTNDSSNTVGSSFEANTDEEMMNSEIRDLRAQLKRIKREHERMQQIQKDLALQYRKMVALLTGFQIKMREEGLCEVGHVLETQSVFFFQKRDNGQVDLLDTEAAQKWKSLVDAYLVRYNSVPAFLAAVALYLTDDDMSSTILNGTIKIG